MIFFNIPCFVLGLLICLSSLTLLAQEQASAPGKTGLEAEVQAAIAAEDNALTQQDLTTKLEKLTAARAKLKDFRQTQQVAAKTVLSSTPELPTTPQQRQALKTEQEQLQAELTTNEAELLQIRQQLETAEGEKAKELNDALKQVRDRIATIKARLRKIETTLAATPEGTHTVQPGESLSIIADRYYGNIQRWPDIFEANRTLITNPDVIEVGMVLVIP